VDLNNDGSFGAGDVVIPDPKGFAFTPTPWTLTFNSAEKIQMPNGDWVYKYPQGLHEFRAVPLDAVEAELPITKPCPAA
jgi:hypothetical protein